MENILTVLFFLIGLIITSISVVVVFKIKIPKRDLIFDIFVYLTIVLISLIIITYGKIVLGIFVCLFGIVSNLLLKKK